jgi:D-beta-D-heptose 7-phosphate kinase/D-beta-D-heptose 1-phosphate adenosyltransferase
MTHETLMKTVEGLTSGSILLLGDFMLDCYIHGDIERISPEAPVPVMKALSRESRPGGAGSVAANIRALDARVICLGVVGDDEAGSELCRKLSLTGANIDHLLSLPGRPTTLKERFVGLAQHRHGQQVLRVDHEDSSELPRTIGDQLLADLKKLLPKVDILCLEDYGKGLLSHHLCRAAIDLAKKARKPVLVDPARTADFSKYAGADLITPNRFEASLAAGLQITDPDSLSLAAEKLLAAGKFNALVITLDKEGAYLLQKGQAGSLIPTRPREVYDVTGAGDVVLAALAVGLASGCDLPGAVAFANIAGGLAVEKPGAATVSRQEILADLIAGQAGFSGKIRTAEQLAQELQPFRRNSQTIVFTNGCFDVLHMGHISLLAQARAKGDVLVVGLNSDESIRANKGPDRPVCSEQQRAGVLAGLESVDYVVIFNDTEPIKLLDKLRPDILVKGEDCIERGVVGRELVEAYGGKVELVPMVPECSTTNIIQTILHKYSPEELND